MGFFSLQLPQLPQLLPQLSLTLTLLIRRLGLSANNYYGQPRTDFASGSERSANA